MSISPTESSVNPAFGYTPVTTTQGTTNNSATQATAASGDADYDMFLQLLVAQLRYQDPMNPTDSTQFLSQNAQFTSLQKMQQVADSMGELVSAQMTFGAAGLIGQQVTYADAVGATHVGTAQGVNFSADGPTLLIGANTVPISMVISVGATTPSTPSTDLPDSSVSPDTTV